MRRLVWILALVAAGCAQLPTGYDIRKTTAITDTDDTTLGIRAAITRHEQAGETVVTTLTSGRDAFYARLALADMAERSLDIQYFLWHKDLTGQVLLYNVAELEFLPNISVARLTLFSPGIPFQQAGQSGSKIIILCMVTKPGCYTARVNPTQQCTTVAHCFEERSRKTFAH